MDPVKIARVRDWPTPKNVTEVQSFVGFVNFYRRFIPEFSHVASPLHHLTKKAEPWSLAMERTQGGSLSSTEVTRHVGPDPRTPRPGCTLLTRN